MEKSTLGFRIPKIWQILKRFTRAFFKNKPVTSEECSTKKFLWLHHIHMTPICQPSCHRVTKYYSVRTPRMFCVETGSLLLGIKANNNIWSHQQSSSLFWWSLSLKYDDDMKILWKCMAQFITYYVYLILIYTDNIIVQLFMNFFL